MLWSHLHVHSFLFEETYAPASCKTLITSTCSFLDANASVCIHCCSVLKYFHLYPRSAVIAVIWLFSAAKCKAVKLSRFLTAKFDMGKSSNIVETFVCIFQVAKYNAVQSYLSFAVTFSAFIIHMSTNLMLPVHAPKFTFISESNLSNTFDSRILNSCDLMSESYSLYYLSSSMNWEIMFIYILISQDLLSLTLFINFIMIIYILLHSDHGN